MTDFEKMYSFESLYKAHKKARMGKRFKSDVIKFEMNVGSNLWDIQEKLRKKEYKVYGYYKFYIYEPKKREIQALRYTDRVIQHSLCDNILVPLIDKRLIYDNYACRIGKGMHFGLKRITSFYTQFYKKYKTDGYVLKADIRKYFNNIDHEVLLKKLRKIIKDKDILDLVEEIIGSYSANEKGKGLPMGNQTSQTFAIYYLDPIDRLVKEKLHIKYYGRYMDDLVLIHHDKEYLKYCLEEMKKVAQQLRLEFNQKTQIFPLKNGIDFLGFHIYLSETGKVIKKLRNSNKGRMKRRFKSFRKKYEQGKIGLEEIERSLASYKGHLQHGHTYKLRKKLYSEFILKRKIKI